MPLVVIPKESSLFRPPNWTSKSKEPEDSAEAAPPESPNRPASHVPPLALRLHPCTVHVLQIEAIVIGRLVTSATLVVTSALLVVTKSY